MIYPTIFFLSVSVIFSPPSTLSVSPSGLSLCGSLCRWPTPDRTRQMSSFLIYQNPFITLWLCSVLQMSRTSGDASFFRNNVSHVRGLMWLEEMTLDLLLYLGKCNQATPNKDILWVNFFWSCQIFPNTCKAWFILFLYTIDLCRCPTTVKKTPVSHTVALGHMFPHHELGHYSLF